MSFTDDLARDKAAEPTPAPRTDYYCWPFECRDYHRTSTHLDGTDPCKCECHEYAARKRGRND